MLRRRVDGASLGESGVWLASPQPRERQEHICQRDTGTEGNRVSNPDRKPSEVVQREVC